MKKLMLTASIAATITSQAFCGNDIADDQGSRLNPHVVGFSDFSNKIKENIVSLMDEKTVARFNQTHKNASVISKNLWVKNVIAEFPKFVEKFQVEGQEVLNKELLSGKLKSYLKIMANTGRMATQTEISTQPYNGHDAYQGNETKLYLDLFTEVMQVPLHDYKHLVYGVEFNPNEAKKGAETVFMALYGFPNQNPNDNLGRLKELFKSDKN